MKELVTTDCLVVLEDHFDGIKDKVKGLVGLLQGLVESVSLGECNPCETMKVLRDIAFEIQKRVDLLEEELIKAPQEEIYKFKRSSVKEKTAQKENVPREKLNNSIMEAVAMFNKEFEKARMEGVDNPTGNFIESMAAAIEELRIRFGITAGKVPEFLEKHSSLGKPELKLISTLCKAMDEMEWEWKNGESDKTE